MNPRERSQLGDRVARARLEREITDRREDLQRRIAKAPAQPSPQRQRAQERLLADPSRSDRTLAGLASTTHVTVAAVRRQLEAAGLLDVVTLRTDSRGTTTCWAGRLSAWG